MKSTGISLSWPHLWRRVLVAMLSSPSILLAISAFSTALAAPNYRCKTYVATTPISTQNVNLSITPPANQSATTAFITSYTSQNFMTSDTNGNGTTPQWIDVNDRYQIYTQLCTPSTFENGTDIEFVVHGCVTVMMVIFKGSNYWQITNHFPESGLIIPIGNLVEMGPKITMSNQR